MSEMKSKVFYHDDLKEIDLGNGLHRRIKAYNENLMIVEVRFDQNAVGTMHTHPHTQCTYILKGVFSFDINGEQKILRAGDTACFPSDVPHGLTCLEEGVLLDIFAPMREDFLK